MVGVLIGGRVRYDERMGKKAGLVVIAALLLTGCASGEPEAAPTVTVAATPEAAPEPVATTSATDEDSITSETEAYLESATAQWQGASMPVATDLIAYGEQVCETMRAGEAPPLVLPGETTADMRDNMSIISAAQDELCPELL